MSFCSELVEHVDDGNCTLKTKTFKIKSKHSTNSVIKSDQTLNFPQDIMQLKVEMQEVLLAKEEQEEVLRRRERELTALKGALKEEVAAHDQEVDKMRDQYEKEISRLQTSLEEAKQVISLPFVSPPSLPLSSRLTPCVPSLPPSSSFPSLSPSSIPETHPVTEECGDKHRIKGALTVSVFCIASCAICSPSEVEALL